MDSGPLTFPALLAGTVARWRTALTVALGTIALTLALALIIPPSYRATASFVTTDGEAGSRGGGLSDLAASTGMSGLASQLGLGGLRNPSESPLFYEQLLVSRELLTRHSSPSCGSEAPIPRAHSRTP